MKLSKVYDTLTAFSSFPASGSTNGRPKRPFEVQHGATSKHRTSILDPRHARGLQRHDFAKGSATGLMESYTFNVFIIGNYYNGLYRVYIGIILGLYRDNGKEHGNYYNGLYRVYIGIILGLYRDNRKENGNYYFNIVLVLKQTFTFLGPLRSP